MEKCKTTSPNNDTMIKGGGICDWYVFPGAKAPLV